MTYICHFAEPIHTASKSINEIKSFLPLNGIILPYSPFLFCIEEIEQKLFKTLSTLYTLYFTIIMVFCLFGISLCFLTDFTVFLQVLPCLDTSIFKQNSSLQIGGLIG